MTTDLVAWLREQLDEDEQMFAALDSTALNGIESTAGWEVRGYVERAPVELDAKRRILAEHAPFDAWADVPGSHGPEIVCQECAGARPHPCPTVRLLALPYADRPGYRQEWRPN